MGPLHVTLLELELGTKGFATNGARSYCSYYRGAPGSITNKRTLRRVRPDELRATGLSLHIQLFRRQHGTVEPARSIGTKWTNRPVDGMVMGVGSCVTVGGHASIMCVHMRAIDAIEI